MGQRELMGQEEIDTNWNLTNSGATGKTSICQGPGQSRRSPDVPEPSWDIASDAPLAGMRSFCSSH